jgi:hypothetical protein
VTAAGEFIDESAKPFIRTLLVNRATLTVALRPR